MAQQPQWAKASSLSRIHGHTQTYHIRQDSSGRVISPTQWPLPDNKQHSQETNIYAPGGIRTYNPIKRVATDPRLRPLGQWDRRAFPSTYKEEIERWKAEGSTWNISCSLLEKALSILMLEFLNFLFVKEWIETKEIAINSESKNVSWKGPLGSSADRDVANKRYLINMHWTRL
jgi:hypothetical protein